VIKKGCLILLFAMISVPAMAADTGDFSAESDAKRWFHEPIPRLCCQIADGHRAELRKNGAGYEARIAGRWYKVPLDALQRGITSPFDSPVIWYVMRCGTAHDEPCIRCLILNPGEMARGDPKVAKEVA
jgi:hypothetical protein